ncbi:hypothetical protein RMSM_03766 [Rhodopirellula maiorica SM1]|uniref:Uncharacterized protein n=1 Tax=Rhodopirellula maiorica SM1 TaxID=1265738 RepID=M5RJ28_9BACT|nr:hypothetical protein RMSM_03766 [Rhodopirellula maiorica SM1]
MANNAVANATLAVIISDVRTENCIGGRVASLEDLLVIGKHLAAKDANRKSNRGLRFNEIVPLSAG